MYINFKCRRGRSQKVLIQWSECWKEVFVSGCSLTTECLCPQLLTLLTSMAGHCRWIRTPRRWFFVALCRYCSTELVGHGFKWFNMSHSKMNGNVMEANSGNFLKYSWFVMICATGSATQLWRPPLFFVFKLVKNTGWKRGLESWILALGSPNDQYILFLYIYTHTLTCLAFL